MECENKTELSRKQSNEFELKENIEYENQKVNTSNCKPEYLNEWIRKENFDETSSVITNSTSDNFTEGTSSIVDSEDLFEYMERIDIEDKSQTGETILKNENIIQKATNSLHNILHTENSTTLNHGNISIENSKHVHVGNITYITGPIQIVQTINENQKTKDKTENHNNSSSENSIKSDNKDYFIGNIERVIADSSLSIVDRRTWLAQKSLDDYEYTDGPVPYVIIAHTATELSLTQAESIYLVRHIQNFHIESMRFNDIAYNFLIGGDGNVYEGRNWGVVGSHTMGYNKRSVGISFIGCFMKELPPKISLNACKLLIKKGVELGYIRSDYKLVGHCQCRPFQSPGKRLFEEIKTWPHFSELP